MLFVFITWTQANVFMHIKISLNMTDFLLQSFSLKYVWYMYFVLPVIYLIITWHTCGVFWQVCPAVPHLLPTVRYGRTYPSMCNSCLFTGPQRGQCLSDEVPVRLLNVCHQKRGQIYLTRWTKKDNIHWGCQRITFQSINIVLAYN